MSIIIAPSILSADMTRLGDQVREAVDGGADWIHVDVMDGRFVPNITFGPMIVDAVRRVTGLPIDVHLMIVEPERHLQSFADAGTNHITVHYETCPHIHRTLQSIREMGMSPGLVINPGTPITTLRELTHATDSVLIMTVNPGFGGQAFIETMLDNPIDKDHMADEMAPLRDLFTKSIVIRTDLSAGTVLKSEHFTVKKPGTGIPAARLPEIVGRRLRTNVKANTRLTEDMLE